MKKRIISFLLALVLVLGLIPAAATTANAASSLKTSAKAIDILRGSETFYEKEKNGKIGYNTPSDYKFEGETVAKKYLNGILLSDKKMAEATDRMIQAMHIKTPSQKTKIQSLSGGNQQKVIFGRWFLTNPDVLLLDEPTRGIDVGAKYEIYELIQGLSKQGKSVIMVSSEMPELLGVCDRIIVMSGGRLAGEVDANNTSQEEIMTLAAKYA